LRTFSSGRRNSARAIAIPATTPPDRDARGWPLAVFV
jgi:hypothetical protein